MGGIRRRWCLMPPCLTARAVKSRAKCTLTVPRINSTQSAGYVSLLVVSGTNLLCFQVYIIDEGQQWTRYTWAPQNCYEIHVSVSLLSSPMSTTTAPAKATRRAGWRSFCCLPARTWGVSSRRRFEIRPLSPIVRRTLLQHLIVARRVWAVGWQSVDALGPTSSGSCKIKNLL